MQDAIASIILLPCEFSVELTFRMQELQVSSAGQLA
jgi:hypothetical protein